MTPRSDDLSPRGDVDIFREDLYGVAHATRRTISMIWHLFTRFDLYSTFTDPAELLIAAAIGSVVDCLDRDLSKVWMI